MFLHLCFILFTGEEGVCRPPLPHRQTWVVGQTPLDADLPPRQTPNADPPLGWADPPGCRPPRQTRWMQTPLGWADPPPPDADSPWQIPWMQTPGVWQTPLYGQQAGGTHPAGKHTCFENKN